VPTLEKGTVVRVEQIKVKRCRVQWAADGAAHAGWVDANVLEPLEEP
jgi:hypothetical protein